MLFPHEIPLWQLVVAQFRLPEPTDHGPSHWMNVRRNGLELCRHHPADEEVVRLFALFHDSCRHTEYTDPDHGSRGAALAIEFHRAGRFQLDDLRMELLVAACRIHNGAPPSRIPPSPSASTPTGSTSLASASPLIPVCYPPRPHVQCQVNPSRRFNTAVLTPHRRMP